MLSLRTVLLWGRVVGARAVGTTLAYAPGLLLGCSLAAPPALMGEEVRPNIVWIVSEDHGPQMGCYGDTFATTPNVDRLAVRGVIYTRVWSCAPVCAPARTTLISGLYPTSSGAEHMRSMLPYPAGKVMFPALLRSAGYYCTNNAKEDYNLAQPGKTWDESSARAHWRNRAPGQPFFAVFNSEKSHESRIRARPHELVHDPAGVRVPAYHPDTPEVRHDWAQYYDGVSAADADAGVRLRELEGAGLLDETIVFYYADHGPGLPRSKRSACDSGLHVPLVVYIPERFRDLRPEGYTPGGSIDRLVAFIDFAPTVLSLANVKPPAWMQGQAFLGRFAAPPRPCAFGFRGRMDERYDLVRSVTDGRYVYVRNFMPHLIAGQHVAYMFETPTTQVWKRLREQHQLTPVQDAFWQPKPPVELYDLAHDRDEVDNLAGKPEHAEIERKLRDALRAWMLEVRDIGFLPEGEIHARSLGTTPFDLGHDEARYPLERILNAADVASDVSKQDFDALRRACADGDSAVRYWGVLGFLMRGATGCEQGRRDLIAALADSSPYVEIAAAEALARFGDPAEQQQAQALLEQRGDPSQENVFVVMAALNAIDRLGAPGEAIKATLRQSKTKPPVPHARYSEYVPRLLQPAE